MKTVLAICIGSFFLLPQVSLQAADNKCQAKSAFEKPVFVTRTPETQMRMEIGLEKPLFEKAHFEKAQINKSLFVRPTLEKPAFVKECIESMPQKRQKAPENTKGFARFPTETGKEWGRIRMDRHKLNSVSHHELKLNRSSIYRSHSVQP